MDPLTQTLLNYGLGAIGFLLAQLMLNIWVLVSFNTRLTRMETHQIHIMEHFKIKLRRDEIPPRMVKGHG